MKRIYITALLISLAGILSLSAQERIYTPELSLPANAAIDQMPNVVLDWNAVTGGNTGIIKYDVQVDTNPTMGTPDSYETEFLTAIQLSDLLFGETYYWRVRAKDGSDVSPWSDIWSFRVIRRVVLKGPNDASEQTTEVEFSWNELTGLNEYELQIDELYYWNSVNSGQTVNLSTAAVVDATHAWVAGAGGLILFFDGTTWTEQESSISTDIYCLSFVDASNGWAVGKGGKIVYFNGTSWSAQTSGTTNDLNGVHMISATEGWAVGKGGTVLHYNGSAWSTQYTASKDLNKVYAVDASHVWAVGKNGLIVSYNGSAWNADDTGGTIKEFSGVAFTSATDGWAVGKTGFMMHYTNGVWSIYDQGFTTKDLNGICFTGPDNGWIVGKTGTVLQFDGIEWFAQTGGVSTNLNFVAFAGTTGFIAGESGALIAYNDNAFNNPYSLIVPSEYLTAEVYNFPFGEKLFWRMRGKHDAATSEWSGARSFTVQPTVELDKPNNHATDQDLDVELRWDTYSELVTYDVQIDDNADFSSPVFLSSIDNTINAEQLHFGVKYYWRVRALHTGDISDWCEPWDFTTVNTVVLVSPANDAVDLGLSPLLDWEDITGISNYYVELSDKSDFSNIITAGTTPADQSNGIVPLVLEKEKSYYWHVRAENGLDQTNWSPTWKFTTIPPVGVEEQTFEGNFNIYPNPAENTVYVQLKANAPRAFRLTLTDVLGVQVLSKELNTNAGNKTLQLDVSSLKEGVYMLRITDNDNSFTRKIIIKR